MNIHMHCDVVIMPDGQRIAAASFDDVDPYRRVHTPTYGLYFDDRWEPPWPYEVVKWPDYGLPANLARFRRSLRALSARASSDGSVEIGCLGGHGRTGTALACLVVIAGVPPANAVSWVRKHYCNQAVETTEQEQFVSAFRA